MFVANITPIFIVAGACGLSSEQTINLVQCAMLIAGIGTLIQLFPLWRIGSGLPIVLGISFTFVSVFCVIGTSYNYNTIIGAILIGGCIEGVLGLFAKYWHKIVAPIVAANVVTAIGFSLLPVGAASFGGGQSSENFGSWQNLLLGTITLICCLVFNILAKSFWNLPFTPEFHLGPIITICLIFLVSATEAIGDTSALCMTGFNRKITDREISGFLACDGFISTLSGFLGCMPITSFSQNVGLIAMTKVVNRKAIAAGAGIMILAGFFPFIGAILNTLPEAVLGGCTIMMFGNSG